MGYLKKSPKPSTFKKRPDPNLKTSKRQRLDIGMAGATYQHIAHFNNEGVGRN